MNQINRILSYKQGINKEESKPIRLALPSKGRMQDETQVFLKNCGFTITRKNRQYIGYLSGFEDEMVLVYNRQKDIIRGIVHGSIDMAIVGYDLVCEFVKDLSKIVVIHEALGFGDCSLALAVPETWEIDDITDLQQRDGKLRVATKFPLLTTKFLNENNLKYELIQGEGSLEVYPALDYADVIVDLVSTGQTLKDNRLKQINGGTILESEAVFIGKIQSLKKPGVLRVAQELLEYFEARLRAERYVSLYANMRGNSPEKIVQKMFNQDGLAGLDGPTISPIINKSGEKMFAVHIIVERQNLQNAIKDLRKIGGSGVVVSPALYIFEEEPVRYKKLIKRVGVESDD